MLKKIKTTLSIRSNILESIFKITKITVMFSFILWLGIIIWNLYAAYQVHQSLKQQQKEINKVLIKKEQVLKQYKQKIADIQLAYKEISKVISPSAVKRLVQKLDSYIIYLNNQKTNLNINIYNPYRIGGFNIRLSTQIPSYIQTVSLTDALISPQIVSLFKQTLKAILNNWDKKIYKPYLYTKVAVQTDNNTLILYLKSSKTNSNLKIKPLLFYGVINDILQMPYFLTTTAVSSSFISESNFSQFYIGWDLEFNQNKGGLK